MKELKGCGLIPLDDLISKHNQRLDHVTPVKLRVTNGLRNPFSDTKRMDITCGSCGVRFSFKVVLQTTGIAPCPHCQSINKWDNKVFFDNVNNYYDRRG